MTWFYFSAFSIVLFCLNQLPPSKRPDLVKKWPRVDLGALEKRVAALDERLAAARKDDEKSRVICFGTPIWRAGVPTQGVDLKDAADLLNVLFRKSSLVALSLRNSNSLYFYADVLTGAEALEILKMLK